MFPPVGAGTWFGVCRGRVLPRPWRHHRVFTRASLLYAARAWRVSRSLCLRPHALRCRGFHPSRWQGRHGGRFPPAGSAASCFRPDPGAFPRKGLAPSRSRVPAPAATRAVCFRPCDGGAVRTRARARCRPRGGKHRFGKRLSPLCRGGCYGMLPCELCTCGVPRVHSGSALPGATARLSNAVHRPCPCSHPWEVG